jgi:hypothetical protein
MQLEERQVCPSCGGDNPVGGEFCWRCYASLKVSTPTGSAAGTTGTVSRPGMPRYPVMPAPPASQTATAPASSSGGVSMIARIVVGVLAGVVGMFAVRTLFQHDPSLPDQLAGTPRMTTQAAKDFEKQMADEGGKWDLKVASGAYGSGTSPSFLVILVQGKAIESTDELFDSLVQGMASSGATVDGSATVSGEHEGADYRCVPVTSAQTQAAACMWRADGTVGMVVGLEGGVDHTRDLLFTTYDAVA